MEGNSQWSLDSLHDFFQQRINDLERIMQFAVSGQEKAFAAQEKAFIAMQVTSDRAINKAEEATSKRLDSMNEFREALTDQSRTMMPRLELETVLKSIDERLSKLENFQVDRTSIAREEAVSRQKIVWIIGTIITLIFGTITVIFQMLRK